MRFGHIELFVKDPKKSRDFYRDVLGFEVADEQGEHFIWLTLGERQFLLRPAKNAQASSTYQDAAAGMVLYTDDLEGTAARLKERGLTFQGTDGSPKCLTFTDLDGHWFQLVNPEDH